MRRAIFVFGLVVACETSGGAPQGSGPSTEGGTTGGSTAASTVGSATASEGSAGTSSSDGGCSDAGCEPEQCKGDSCSGHGVCSELGAGIACVCDEGFVGEACESHGDDFDRRTLLVPGLADPDVLREHDDLFYLVGTGSTVVVPIYESNDLEVFDERPSYDPSALDRGRYVNR